MAKPHLFEGTWLNDQELESRLENLSSWVAQSLEIGLESDTLLLAAEKYSAQLTSHQGNYSELLNCLSHDGKTPEGEIATTIHEMAAFLTRPNLEQKLKRELGSCNPFVPSRQQYQDAIFEAWAPLGLLVHIAPSNSPTVAPLSVIEGLLSRNICFLKTSGTAEGVGALFPQLFLEGLLACDETGQLKHFIAVAQFSSRRQDWLARLIGAADGIAVWGGEEAVQAVKKQASSSTRVIEWGHKISFIYLTKEVLNEAADSTPVSPENPVSNSVLEQAAREVCYFEQQACSSPQCIYIEAQDWADVVSFGRRFAAVLQRVSATIPRMESSIEEKAEITLVTELAREESCFGQAEVIEAPSKEWRVLMDARSALVTSPLFRTVWIKPLPRDRIVETLRPMRTYLQTAGLACELADVAELSELLVKSGVIRIRRIGEMAGSYSGEAHDGVYALQRYCRRISIQAGSNAQGISNFADLKSNLPPQWRVKPPIMDKAAFQEMKVDAQSSHLFFKSGGSSGLPKMSVFSYPDYHDQMQIGAEGLYAAGLDPLIDRNMNLFFSGQLYGGFLSIFSVLEKLEAVQFPMAAQMDFPMVAESIIRNQVNVLLGMPSYLIQLFEKCGETLKKYGKVAKVFYGGEHFNDAQRRFLREQFGVQTIKSVGYGSVDTGPLGYQCSHCDGGIHHLHQRLQQMEIVDIHTDQAVSGGQIGRMLFTSRMRRGQHLNRYELGDVGHWIEGPCPCGRAAPRFRLLGRTGDVFRIGSVFLNYQNFTQILSEQMGYAGPVQLILTHEKLREKILVNLSNDDSNRSDANEILNMLLSNYDDLNEVVSLEKLLGLEIAFQPGDSFEKTKGSGKLIRIIDLRGETLSHGET